jgi:transcriptional regulator with XRE-family HTH domain
MGWVALPEASQVPGGTAGKGAAGDDMRMTFAERLREVRKSKGMTAKDMASKLNINYTTYANYENQGREPKYDLLCKIAAVLHVSIDELLGYTAEEADDTNLWRKFCHIDELIFLK